MYYLNLNNQTQHVQELPLQKVPTFGPNPDDFIEMYDESGEFMEVEQAFRVNVEELTPDQELELFHAYASTMDDSRFIEGSFKLLEKGWVTIPEEQVESVVWREGANVFCFKCDTIPVAVDESLTYSRV